MKANVLHLLSDLYCHPLYAYTMEGYGVDIAAPQPPFVLFKVLYRLVRESFIGSLFSSFYLLFSIFVRLLSSVIGYLIGFIFGGTSDGEAGKITRQPVSKDDRIPRPSWGPDLSLMDDEFL